MSCLLICHQDSHLPIRLGWVAPFNLENSNEQNPHQTGSEATGPFMLNPEMTARCSGTHSHPFTQGLSGSFQTQDYSKFASRSLFGPFPSGRAGAQALSLSNIPGGGKRTGVLRSDVLTQCHFVQAPSFLALNFLIYKMHPTYIIGLLCSSNEVIVMKAL